MVDLYENIKIVCYLNNMTVKQLASAVNLTPLGLSKGLQNKTMNIAKMMELSDYLEISLDELTKPIK